MTNKIESRIRKTKTGYSIKANNGYTFHADELADGGYEVLHKLNGEQLGKVVHCYGTARAKELMQERVLQYQAWVNTKQMEAVNK